MLGKLVIFLLLSSEWSFSSMLGIVPANSSSDKGSNKPIPHDPVTANQVFWVIPFEPTSHSQPYDGPLLFSPPSSFSTATLTLTTVLHPVITPPPTLTSTKTVVVIVTQITTISPSSAKVIPTSWSMPKDLVDLEAFNVTLFTTGKQNLEVVSSDQIPGSSIAVVIDSTKNPASTTQSSDEDEGLIIHLGDDEDTSVLQVLYPENSINPGSAPVGGAQFYASPLDISRSRSVTLEYSVFFPQDFDWVLGGKLPGLYGGKTGCSGGVDALDCFSTRLMWRAGGAGELYLYAPRFKQSASLCSDSKSVCNSNYGLSIGRGSFFWNAGSWTHVKQNVTLNTPGQQDGIFALDVDGERVIERRDILYRDVPKSTKGNDAPGRESQKPETVHDPADGDDSLESILRRLLSRGADGRRSEGRQVEALLVSRPLKEPVGLSGIFFSTFFGGHELDYASPRDQLVWFKDFKVEIEPIVYLDNEGASN